VLLSAEVEHNIASNILKLAYESPTV